MRSLYSMLTPDLVEMKLEPNSLNRLPYILHTIYPPQISQGAICAILLHTHVWPPCIWFAVLPIPYHLISFLTKHTWPFLRVQHPHTRAHPRSTLRRSNICNLYVQSLAEKSRIALKQHHWHWKHDTVRTPTNQRPKPSRPQEVSGAPEFISQFAATSMVTNSRNLWGI